MKLMIALLVILLASPCESARGTMTYYAGSPVGATGRRLVPFKSVAVPKSMASHIGHEVYIKGIGIARVDDLCYGSACKTFDLYIGTTTKYKTRIPRWELGNIPIEYSFAN